MSANNLAKLMKTLVLAAGLALAVTAVSMAPTASAWCTTPQNVGGPSGVTVNVAACSGDCYVEVLDAQHDAPCVNALP